MWSPASDARSSPSDRFSGFGCPSLGLYETPCSVAASTDSHADRLASRDTPGAESARHELEAAREALRHLKAKHARELEAVRRGWTSRHDELTQTIQKLRSQLAAATEHREEHNKSADTAGANGDGLPTGLPTDPPPAAHRTGSCCSPSPKSAASSTVAAASSARSESAGSERGGGGAAAGSEAAAAASASHGASRVAGVLVGGERSVGSPPSSSSPSPPSRARLAALTATLADAEEAAAISAADAHAAKEHAASMDAEVAYLRSELGTARSAASDADRRAEDALAHLAASVAATTAHAYEDEASAARAAEADARSAHVAMIEAVEGKVAALAALAAALDPPEGDGTGTVEGDWRRAVASAEGRLQLEKERHVVQLERLQFENEELRRATRAKTDKIAALREQLATANGAHGS